LRLAVQPDPEVNWHQTRRVPTESLRSSEKRLTSLQPQMADSCRGCGIYPTSKNFIHDLHG
ncbi:hypothetical protein GW17_00036026, partial [Ensete ventricosum]